MTFEYRKQVKFFKPKHFHENQSFRWQYVLVPTTVKV